MAAGPRNILHRIPADIVAAQGRRVPVAARAAQGEAAPPRVLSYSSPYEVPPAGSIEFHGYAQANTNAVETVELAAAALSFDDLMYGVIASIDFYLNDVTPVTELYFQVHKNGGRVPGLDRIRIFPRNATSVSRGFDPYLRLAPRDSLQVFYENVTGLPHLVGVSYFGWRWSRDIHLAMGEKEAS